MEGAAENEVTTLSIREEQSVMVRFNRRVWGIDKVMLSPDE
jgi:hypothetical protein